MKKIYLLIGAIIFSKITLAQVIENKFLIGKWEFGFGESYTTMNFINDSTLIIDAPLSKNLVMPYELVLASPSYNILIEGHPDIDSVDAIYSHIEIVNNDEIKIHYLK